MKNEKIFKFNNLNELIGLTYDLNGNSLRKDEFNCIYDPLNRLIEATSEKRRILFQYDPLGRRLTKILMEKNSLDWEEIDRENYLYDGEQEIGALRGDGTLKNFKVLGADLRKNQPATVAIELDKKVFAPILDMQGTICRLIDPTLRKVESSYEFTAFGEEKKLHIDENPWRYASMRFDPELNLVYFGKRYFDPFIGRWLTTDPVGFQDSINLYQYAFNNPNCYYDPNGEFIFLACIPFAALFTPVAVKICVDAVAVGVGCWGLYKSAQFAADAMGSSYSLSEKGFHILLSESIDSKDIDKQSDAPNKKPRYSGKELGNDSTKCPDEGFEWKGKGKVGSREGSWYNKKTGESLHPDLDHPPPKKPHWDYEGPGGEKARLNTDGTWEWK